jgi:arsenate reductase
MKILYICTHNRCRSILSEAITNSLASQSIQTKSAGSQPSGEVHPLSLKYLQKSGYSSQGLRSQSWDDFEQFQPDLVVTVCDSAADEACPIYFGNSVKVHWGLSDPSKTVGTEQEIEAAFIACINEIAQRVEKLKLLAARNLPRVELKQALASMGAH